MVMGARGPAPTPTRILQLRGSWRGELNKNEPTAPTTPPAAPEWLDEEGRAEWDRTTAALAGMEILSSADRAVLAGLCQNWSLFVRVSKILNGIDVPRTLCEARPLISSAAEAYRNYAHACQQFGLSPSSRSRVQANVEKKPQSASAKYFG
jgi:P27 family predicted phage terminase small subunit